MVFESIVDPVLRPLLNLPILWALILVSFLISLLITLAYKWMTDQHLMKILKDDMKKFRNQMKEFKKDPQKVMEIQKKSMQTNMKYMMHSMKPTLVTFIPIIIIFGWLSANFAYAPILPDTQFTTTLSFEESYQGNVTLVVIPEQLLFLSDVNQEVEQGKATWRLKGEEGTYDLTYQVDNRKYTQDLLITSKQAYKEPITKIGDGVVSDIQISNKKIKPLNLFGWKLGWLGTYIIFSIIFSMGLRKILKLH